MEKQVADTTGQAGWIKASTSALQNGPEQVSWSRIRRWMWVLQGRAPGTSGVRRQGIFFSFLCLSPTTSLHCSCNTLLLLLCVGHPSSVNTFCSKRCLYLHLHSYKKNALLTLSPVHSPVTLRHLPSFWEKCYEKGFKLGGEDQIYF